MPQAVPRDTDRTRSLLVWRLGLLTFLLAAATGLTLRLAPITGPFPGLRFDNLRHAHSHLMYFGWATPLLMAFVVERVTAFAPQARRRGHRIVVVTFVAAWVAYLPFLLSGYAPTEIGGLTLPLSVATAALNGLAWWWFAAWYRRTTREMPRDVALRLFDGAVVLLVLASVGAMGRGVVDALGITDAFARSAPIHAFLDLFSDGWFLFAVLGLAWQALAPSRMVPRWTVPVLTATTVPVFLLTLPVDIVAAPVRGVAALASVGALITLGLLLRSLWPAAHGRAGWRLVLGFVALRVAAGLVLLTPAGADWAMGAGLRVLHLHILGLGILTGGLVATAADRGLLAPRCARHWRIAITTVVASIVLLTDLWPSPLQGRWTLYVVAAAAALPLLTTLGSLRRGTRAGTDKDEAMPIAVPRRAGAILLALLAAGVAVITAGTAVGAQEEPDGAQLFSNNCATCHGAMGEGQGTAPPLVGNDRVADAAYVEEILRNGLTGPIEVNGQTYNDEMPNFAWMTDAELAALAAFVQGIQDGSGEPAPEPTVPAEPIVGDAARGEAFFTGRADLMAGGPSCAACHGAGPYGGLGGTTLGPDLTGVADRYGGEANLAQALANPPSPVMRPLFATAAMTDQERADLAAFLVGPGAQPAAATGGDALTLGGAVGLGALLVLLAVLWRGRHRHFLTRRSAR